MIVWYIFLKSLYLNLFIYKSEIDRVYQLALHSKCYRCFDEYIIRLRYTNILTQWLEKIINFLFNINVVPYCEGKCYQNSLIKITKSREKNFSSQKMKKWEKGRKIYHSNKNLKRKKKGWNPKVTQIIQMGVVPTWSCESQGQI